MKCPGQDMKYWKDDAIFDVACPKCGSNVEFYKDDTSRKCPSCSHRFVNPKMDFGCASYCQFAEQCLGTLPEEFTGPRNELIKDKIAVEVKRFYHKDFKSVRKISNAARYAETLGKLVGGNLALILSTTYLHGIDESVVAGILDRVGASPEMLGQIRALAADIGRPLHTDSELESKIIHDALLLSDIQDQLKTKKIKKEEISDILEQEFVLAEAKDQARTMLF
jgi:hypothetical protein